MELEYRAAFEDVKTALITSVPTASVLIVTDAEPLTTPTVATFFEPW